ncbi:hypothetical protein Vadar_016702 [Vaccinium darrowii]|uniref:Uncharacterized protein n=1 Tax=Vaccinium darrowii TaxID=229202 RepID=A0ACB7XBB3_9ERIC|nr:hypothetical protein Vadar_016702 [Vaccinium darrowii]
MEEEFLESDFIFPENLFSEEEPVVFQGHLNSRYFTSTNPILMKRSQKKGSNPTFPINITPENFTGDSCIQSVETDFFDDDVDDQLVPPHVTLGRRISDRKMAFPVLTGKGRTLRGRDLCQFRNSVLRMTGFLEGNVTPQKFLRK